MKQIWLQLRILGILLLAGWTFPGTAWTQTLTDGHLFERVDLVTDTGFTHLQIDGAFIPGLYSRIQIIPDPSFLQITIVIPQALVDKNGVPDELDLSPGALLNQVTIEENINLNEEPPTFEVSITMLAPSPVLVTFDGSRSDESRLMFAVTERHRIQDADLLDAEKSIEKELEAIAEKKAPPEPAVSDVTILPVPTEEKPKPKAKPKARKKKRPKARKNTRKSAPPLGRQRPSVTVTDNMLLHPISALLMYQRPTTMQVSILNASPRRKNAQQLAILLDQHQRRNLEDRVGMKLQITNISSVREAITLPKTKIYFRPNYLSAALALGEVIPGDQIVEPMPMEHKGKLGVDIEIYVGSNFE